MTRFFCAALLVALFAALTTGCATSDPDRESDLPWNMPQSWEGAPTIPGLSE